MILEVKISVLLDFELISVLIDGQRLTMEKQKGMKEKEGEEKNP